MSKRYPKHMMGKRRGYTLHKGGQIQVAPGYCDTMRKIIDEERAVDALLAAVTKQCHELYKPLMERREAFWLDIKDDYRLGENVSYRLNFETGMLEVVIPAASQQGSRE